MISFANPSAFLLFIFLIGIVIWKIFRRGKSSASFKVSAIKIFSLSSSSIRTSLVNLPEMLKILGICFMIVGLARPQKADTLVKRNVEGIDIMIVLDISDSMLIEDMEPLNRLESAKETIKKFVKGRNSDKIGIVIFAGESFTLVPLTLDYDLILSRVSEVTTAQQARIQDGTAIGVALANGAGRLRESTAKNRVMIFLTDGENNRGTIDPETGLNLAKGYGIKIYSIGIGRDGPTKIPVYTRDAFGNKFKSYQPFESTVNEDLLSRMGKETGGRYFRASKEDSLGEVFKEIDRLEKTKVDENKFTRYTELFSVWLIWGLIAYGFGVSLSYTWLRSFP